MKTLSLLSIGTLLSMNLFAQMPVRKIPAATKKPYPHQSITGVTNTKPALVKPPQTSAAVPVAATSPVPLPSRPAAPVPAESIHAAVTHTVKIEKRARNSGIQVGILAGGTFANMQYTGIGLAPTPPMKISFHAGLLVDIPLGNHLSVQPNLLYVTKGEGQSTDYDELSLNYVELPITLYYLVPIGAGLLRLGAGPYAAYGLSASTSTRKDKVNFGSGEDEIKPLDYGARVAVQFQLSNGFLLGVNYSYGLANLQNKSMNSPSSDFSVKNRAIGLSVGYVFGGKR